ncbi:MAG TPA: glucose PTS transporter subunit IIA [Symbiobacteriaceae bacterium]|nr:glucose PTS transporter subunit IIA [Symbiobacteriaceae bacterium]
MKGDRAFFERLAAALIIPVTLLPLAALMLAAGSQLGIEPLRVGGLALIQSWLPLFYAIGLAIGFSEGDAMAVLSAVVTFLTMQSVAVAVAGDPGLNMGVVGGLITGATAVALFHRVKRWVLPEWLGLFSGKRMGPVVGTVAGSLIGLVAGWSWPPIKSAIILLGQWLYAAGPVGAFVYGASTRILLPTGLHHILLQAVDNQIGGWTDPATGKWVTGEYLRFLAGDPAAGRFLSGFFLTLGFASLGIGLALIRQAKTGQRRRVSGLMGTGMLTAAVLGITEPIEFAFIFASPVLWVLHILFAGLASLLAYLLGIRAGGYALPMLLINLQQSERSWLLLPIGLLWSALYFVSFSWVIRRWRPRVLGQEEESFVASTGAPAATGDLTAGAQMLAHLGGAANLLWLDACMTRLRVQVAEVARVDQAGLRAQGAVGLVWDGPNLQVVLGTRAPQWRELVTAAMSGETGATVRAGAGETRGQPSGESAGAQPGASAVVTAHATSEALTLLAPLTGRVLPLSALPDPAFAEGQLGQGLAIEPTDGWLVAPCQASVTAIFPGGHAIGLTTPTGIEILIHIGLDSHRLAGQGIHLRVEPGAVIEAGHVLGWLDLAVIRAAGVTPVTPIVVTTGQRVTALAQDGVSAAAALLQIAG